MPVSANAAARFTTEIDLPSAGPGEVTSSVAQRTARADRWRAGVAGTGSSATFSGWRCHIASSEVRRDRYASAVSEAGIGRGRHHETVGAVHLHDRDLGDHRHARRALGAGDVTDARAEQLHHDEEHEAGEEADAATDDEALRRAERAAARSGDDVRSVRGRPARRSPAPTWPHRLRRARRCPRGSDRGLSGVRLLEDQLVLRHRVRLERARATEAVVLLLGERRSCCRAAIFAS